MIEKVNKGECQLLEDRKGQEKRRMSTFNITINYEGDKTLKYRSPIPYPRGPINIQK